MMPVDLGVDWLTGEGPQVQYFRDGDPLTELLREHVFIEGARDEIAYAIAQGATHGPLQYDLGGIFDPLKYARDASTILCGGVLRRKSLEGITWWHSLAATGPLSKKSQSIRWTETIKVVAVPNPQPGPSGK
jgi:hypothetical protein